MYDVNCIIRREGDFEDSKKHSPDTLYDENGVKDYEGGLKDGKSNCKDIGCDTWYNVMV